MRIIVFLIIFLQIGCSTKQVSRSPNGLDKSPVEVGVLGDLEGDWRRFSSFISQGDILFENSEGHVDLREDKQFVFLGDLSDRGPGTLRIMQSLLDLKKKYPERVTLILGNREINKLKIFTLINQYKDSPVPELIFPYYKTFLKKKYGLSFPENISLKDFQKLARPYDDEVTRLQVFLIGMNAKDAFEYRREELELLYSRSFNDIEVFYSFKRDMTKNSLMYQYLKEGELIKVIDGNLFTHGAISSENLGHIPGEGKRFDDVELWREKLNSFMQKNIDEWFDDNTQGQALLDYHAPQYKKSTNPFSVIYARFSDSTGNPSPPPKNVIKKLNNNGIHRVIVGHTPTGDHPIVVKTEGLEVILADNSYSKLTSSRVLLRGRKARITSKTPDEIKILAQTDASDLRNPIGLRTRDGWRVLGIKESDGQYYLMKIQGKDKNFTTNYKTVSSDYLARPGILDLPNDSFSKSCSKMMNWLIRKRIPLR